MDFTEFKDIVLREFPFVSKTQISQFEAMEPLYREWNSKINVVSRKDIDNLYEHHILHSLGVALYLKYQRPEVFSQWIGTCATGMVGTSGGNSPECAQTGTVGLSESGVLASADGHSERGKTVSVLDLGCGGGFPGLPLAVLFPSAEFTLCDSIGKKITVAREVALSLGLKNVETVNARAETLTGPYDWVVSRAVTSLENFIPWVKGKYRCGILYLKGGDLTEEIALAMGRWKMPKGSVGLWPISSVLREEYYEGKMVISINK